MRVPYHLLPGHSYRLEPGLSNWGHIPAGVGSRLLPPLKRPTLAPRRHRRAKEAISVSWFRTNPEPDMRRDIEREREREHEQEADREAEARRYDSGPRVPWWRRFRRKHSA